MKRTLLLVALLLVAGPILPACHNATSNDGASEHGAVVVGTVVDASTGKSVANARIEGPGGRKARSDDRGRFQLEGLEVGTTGEVKATGPDGRTASVQLRRLAAQKLEVVLYLKQP
jgi:hypothetical protein